MKRKLLAIISVVAVVFVAAVLWRVDSFVFGDRMSWAEAQARSQMVSIYHAVQIETKALERIVYSFSIENFRKDKINWNSLQPYYAVAALNFGSQGETQTQSIFVKEKSVAFNWNADFLNKALGKISGNKLSGGSATQVFVKPFQDANKGRHVAMVFVNGNKAYALVGAGEIFQSLIDAQKGSLNTFSIVNNSGLTVGHSVPEYVGTLLTEDPIYKIAMQSGVTQGVGVFDSSDGQKIFGLYNQVPNSNLLIVSSAALKDIMKGRGALLWQFFFLGIGLILVGVAGILLVIRPHEKSLEQLRLHVMALMSGKKDFNPEPMTSEIAEIDGLLASLHVGPAVSAVPSVSAGKIADKTTPKLPVLSEVRAAPTENFEKIAQDMQQEKMNAYRRVASALGHEMRAPLSSILGHSQMVLAHSQDPEIVTNINSILRESRAARGVLEKLFSFAGEQELEKNEMKIETAIIQALSKVDVMLSKKGVKLDKDFSETSKIPISIDELSRALENIVVNSVEAMERMAQKNLTVKLFEDTAGIHLQISDSGEGIEPQNLSQIFDPFFTTRSFQNHLGLGLAVVVGILKEHGATLQVASKRGEGTQVNILFVSKALPAVAAKNKFTDNVNINYPQNSPQNIPQDIPQAPTSALVEAQEKAIDELSNNQQFDASLGTPPAEVNIDSLLELPPRPPPTSPPPLLSSVDTDVPRAIVTAPKVPPPPLKSSKIDGYRVDIRKPGKR